jgi:hypothetical protein
MRGTKERKIFGYAPKIRCGMGPAVVAFPSGKGRDG